MWSGQASVKSSKNPCDFIMYSKPYLFLLEMKSTKGTSFSFNEKIIKQHQIDSLLKAQEHDGVSAGFLFNFRDRVTVKTKHENSVYFINIADFIQYKENSNKKSVNETTCMEIGFRVNCKIKVSHYKYDIKNFVERFSLNYISESGAA